LKKTYYTMDSRTDEYLMVMGEQIKYARLLRNLTSEELAWRAGISRATLCKVEAGDPSVAIGIYGAVLHILGHDKDLMLIARGNEMALNAIKSGLIERKRVRRPGTSKS